MYIQRASLHNAIILALMFVAATLASYVNYVVTVVLFIFFSFFLRWNIKYVNRLLVFLIFAFLALFNMYFFNNLAGIDAQVFYSNLVDSSYKELLMLEYERQIDGIGFAKSRETFPAILDIFFYFFEKENFNSYNIFLFNSFFWFCAVLAWAKLLAEFYDEKIVKVAVVFLLISPSTSYWLNNFGKDIFSISICILAACQFVHRRYFFSVALIVFASFFRPYSIVLFFSYLLPFIFSMKMKVFAAMGAIIFQTLLASKPLIGVFNTIVIFTFLFFSPNPLNINNWSFFSFETWEYSPFLFVVEGCFLGVIFILAIVLFGKRFSSFYGLTILSIFLSISIIATVLVLVGETALAGKDIAPSLGSLGDNFVRKKLAVWPLMSILVGVVIFNLKRKRIFNSDISKASSKGAVE